MIIVTVTFVCNNYLPKEPSETNSQQKTQRQKNYMATLEAVSLSTATYTGDTAVEPDGDEMDGEETGFDIGGEDWV